MSVSSSTFGAVRLTDSDADKFRKQLIYGRPKQAAVEAHKRGKVVAGKYVENGYVKVTLRSKHR